jgi:succinate dehydrogenase/fumarate reductase flavoprotein subunit
MVQEARTLDTDILILGAGGAGLFAALHAHKASPDLSITVAVKGLLGKCGCTRMVQGGYNVALARRIRSSGTSWTRSRAASGFPTRSSPGSWWCCESNGSRARE